MDADLALAHVAQFAFFTPPAVLVNGSQPRRSFAAWPG